MVDVGTIVITSAITGLFSTVGTVVALRVHVLYLRERQKEHADDIKTIFKRINGIEVHCPTLHSGKEKHQ